MGALESKNRSRSSARGNGKPYAGGLSAKTRGNTALISACGGMLNASRFVEFLKDFRRGGRRRVFLVVDGHPSHHAKIVKSYVQSTKGMLELHILPPYAPDLNPDEFVWQHAKTNGVAKKPLKKNESLKERVPATLAAIKAAPKLIKSFFRAPSVAYATLSSVIRRTLMASG
jgi:transposase